MFDSAADVLTIVDPKDAAESAGLRYVSDARPGISRRKSGKGFTYIRADGSKLSEAAVLRRIKALAIPPAWADVWICPGPGRPHPGDRSRCQGPKAVPLPSPLP